MREDELELGRPRVVADTVIRPIARRRIATIEGEGAAGIVAQLTPVGILVEDDGTSEALALDGDELPEHLLEDLPTPGGE